MNEIRRLEEMNSYNVVEYTVGSTRQEERITFSTVEEMEKAYADVNNGADFNIEIEEKSEDRKKILRIIKVSYKMVRQKLYEGQIQFGAITSRGGE